MQNSRNKNKKRPHEAEAAAAGANKSPPHKCRKTSTIPDASLPNDYAADNESRPQMNINDSSSGARPTTVRSSKDPKPGPMPQGGRPNHSGEGPQADRRDQSVERGEPFELEEVKGDLFRCPPGDAMAHCVSKDLAMGKGIAVMFKKRFGGVDRLKAQGKGVGEVAILKRNRTFVYYLITKLRYFHKPSLQTVFNSLLSMRNHMVKNNVTSLSMPTIGCGLNGLKWGDVSGIIKDVFRGTGIRITIYHYDGN